MPRVSAWMIAVAGGLIAGVFLGQYRCSDCQDPDRSARLCQEGERHGFAPASLEDELLERALSRQGRSLIQQGRTVSTRALASQLANSVCQLELPPIVPSAGDATDLPRLAKDSVVVIGGLYLCNKCTRWHTAIASGFVIHASGAVVTNYHVVDAPEDQMLVVMTADQRVFPVQRVLAASRADDLAILQVEAEGLQPLPLAASVEDAPVGAAISVISHPASRFYCYTAGIVSRYMRTRTAGQTIDAMAITADYARGSSGAPVLNSRGQVVGVVSSTQSIYYTEEGGRQRDLQMVFKTCIPAVSLLKLIRPAEPLAGGESADAQLALRGD